jgi:putative spermidine/putrescine transport system substrate-binding protein
MRFTRTRGSLVALAAVSIIVAGCGALGGGGSDKAATATSAEDMGGMAALEEAAKAEGKLNVIALPRDWANYGEILDAFAEKYGITIDEQQPDANSQQEIDAANSTKGTDRAPDVFDLGANVALANTALFAPYKVAAWADIPDNLKEASGLWVSDYAGFTSIGCDVAKVPLPATVADLLKPEYKGMIALNGDPTKAAAGYHGVVMAALANGGSADDIAPGVDFFKQLSDAGNLLPVDPTPATIASGQTPCVIDWEYNNAAQATEENKAAGIDWQVVIPSDAPPVASYYIQAINKDAPNPAAARLWQEYLYSADGQNAWLRGFARPVLQEKLIADGTIDQDALGKLAEATEEPVVLTQEQLTAGQEYLTGNWTITIE